MLLTERDSRAVLWMSKWRESQNKRGQTTKKQRATSALTALLFHLPFFLCRCVMCTWKVRKIQGFLWWISGSRDHSAWAIHGEQKIGDKRWTEHPVKMLMNMIEKPPHFSVKISRLTTTPFLLHAPVCPSKLPCVDPKRPRVCWNTCARGAGIHGDVLNVHTGAFSACHTTPHTHLSTHRTHHEKHKTRHNTTQKWHTTRNHNTTRRDRERRQKKTRQDEREEDKTRQDKTNGEERGDKTEVRQPSHRRPP